MNRYSIQMWLLWAGSIYFVISEIWGLDYTVQVLGVFLLLATLVTIYIRIARKYDGQIVVETTDKGGKRFSLQLEEDPVDLEWKEAVSFKIVSKLPE